MFQPGVTAAERPDQQQTQLCVCYTPETLDAGANPAVLCQQLQSAPPRRWRRLLLRCLNRNAEPPLDQSQRCRLDFTSRPETFLQVQGQAAASR